MYVFNGNTEVNKDITVEKKRVMATLLMSAKESSPLLTVQGQKKLRLLVSVPEACADCGKVDDWIEFNMVYLRGDEFKAKISNVWSARPQTTFRSIKKA